MDSPFSVWGGGGRHTQVWGHLPEPEGTPPPHHKPPPDPKPPLTSCQHVLNPRQLLALLGQHEGERRAGVVRSCRPAMGRGRGLGSPPLHPRGPIPPNPPPPDPHTPPHAVDVRLHRCRHVEVDDGGHVLEVDAPRHAVLGVRAFTAGGNEMGGGWGGEGNPVSVGTRSPGRGTPPQHRRGGTRSTATARGGAQGQKAALRLCLRGGIALGAPVGPRWHPWDPGW